MYIDTNIFAFAHNDPGVKGDRARALLKKIAKGEQAMTSVLVVDEMMWVLRKNRVAERTRRIVEMMYATRNLEIVEVPATTPLRALDFIERHNLKPRDAMHLAVMEHFREREIASDDADFDRIPNVKRIRL